MNLNEFQNGQIDNLNIANPNLTIRGSQGNSTINVTNPNLQKRVVTPQDMGFTHEEPKRYKTPEEPILDRMDKVIERKRKEAVLMANAIEESDGEGISEEEFQDILVQAKDELVDDGIPMETHQYEQVMPKKSTITMIPNENPTYDLMDELEAELEKDEAEYHSEVMNAHYEAIPTPKYSEMDNNYYKTPEPEAKALVNNKAKVQESVKDTTFSDFESGDINFDKESEDLEENVDEAKLAEKEQKEQLEKLSALVREKITPVSKTFDISTFSISKRPAANTIATPRASEEKIADWVLMSSQKPIYMRRFTGTEMERLSNGGKGRTRLNQALDTWQLIYNHIVDPNKPATVEEWAKVTSFLDIDHIFMAIYRANFEGSNYIPYGCTNPNCTEKTFLSDNFDIMDMCEFADKKAKAKFDSIIGRETNTTSGLYSTEIIPVSDDYAFVFREPSIYNIIFESAVLDEEFVDKFGELISMCSYIDEIYYINRETRELQPVRTNVYPNNIKKTVKSRIINFSKYINTLNSDQYNTIMAYMHKIGEGGESLTYRMPEVTCPNCKTVIPASKQTAQALVFLRHQLAALATL